MKTSLSQLQQLTKTAIARKSALILLAVLSFFSNSPCAAAGKPAVHENAKKFGATITSIATVTSSPANAATVQYTATFGAAVTGVTAANFALTTGSGVTGASVTSVSGSGTTYTVTVNTGTGDGTIELDLVNAAGISPVISTSLPFAGQSYTIDKTAPTVGTLYEVSSNINSSFAVVGDVITLFFGTSETIQQPAIVTIGGHTVIPVNTGTNQFQASYQMTTSDMSGRIHFTLQFTDLAGNTSATYNDLAAGDDVEFSSTAPYASNVSFTSNNASNTTAFIGNTVTLSFTVSQAVATPVITIAGHSVTTISTGGNGYTASYIMVAGDNSGNIPFSASFTASSVTTQITNLTTSDNIVYNNTPTVSVSGSIPSLSSVPGVASASEQFTVSGFNLSSAISVEAPTGFEVSADNMTFGRLITVGSGLVVNSIPVFIRLAAVDLSGTYQNDVLVYSNSASEKSLAASPSTVAAQLRGLVLSSGTLSPVFKNTTFNYSAAVATSVTGVTVTATNADGVAPISVNGTAVVSASPSGAIPLVVGTNKISVVVTSQDNTLTQAYSVTVTRPPSGNAALSNLKISSGTLSPVFNYLTTSYTASVSNATTSITVTPSAADATASITVNGTAVITKTASAPIALAAGSNTITVKLTAQNGTTTDTYTIVVTRAPSTVATLSALAINNGTLSPAFATGTNSYSVLLGATAASIKITPTVTDPTATIKVNGTTATSGSPTGAIALSLGANTITTVVTAQDGTTTDTYTMMVYKGSANAALSSLKLSGGTLSPVFNYQTNSYTASVGSTVTSLTVTPASADATATITVNGTAVVSKAASGPIALVLGPNTITVALTAQNGITTDTYSIVVTRAPSTIATLSALKTSIGTLAPAFASGTNSYTTTVAASVNLMTITPTNTDAAATVTVNGTAVTSGSASGTIALSIGANTINTVVTAQDGATTDTYTLTVYKGATNAVLSNLALSGGTALSPIFNYQTTSYTANVANAVNSITETPSSADANATIMVNGTAVTSKTASGAIALAVGANTITTVVTAQNGFTTDTYTVVVTRVAGGADGYDPIATGTGISVTRPTETPVLTEDGISVHQSLSPNGDGINDFLTIDNIGRYPDNKLTIMNRNGQLVFEAKGYDNNSKVFNGHSNQNGQMQLPGTYFYQLDYTVNGIIKHKTGFLVLKY